MDVSKAYTGATRTHAPQAVICYDPFHIMQWVNRALDRVYAEAATGPGRASMSTPDWKATRWALRTGENKLNDQKRALVNQITRTNRHIGRAWTLKEQLRDIYRIQHPPGGARQYLRRWITAAKRSRINAFVHLAKRLEVYFEEIITAIELGISNALIEGINAKIRLINARGYGHHSAKTLTSMIYLCLGGRWSSCPQQPGSRTSVRSMSSDEVTVVLGELDAALDKLAAVDLDTLTHPELLAVLDRPGNPPAPPTRRRTQADRPAGRRGRPHRAGRQEPGRGAGGPAADQPRRGAPAHRRSRGSRCTAGVDRRAVGAPAGGDGRGSSAWRDRTAPHPDHSQVLRAAAGVGWTIRPASKPKRPSGGSRRGWVPKNCARPPTG